MASRSTREDQDNSEVIYKLLTTMQDNMKKNKRECERREEKYNELASTVKSTLKKIEDIVNESVMMENRLGAKTTNTGKTNLCKATNMDVC